MPHAFRAPGQASDDAAVSGGRHRRAGRALSKRQKAGQLLGIKPTAWLQLRIKPTAWPQLRMKPTAWLQLRREQHLLLAALVATGLLLVAVLGSRGLDKSDTASAAQQRAVAGQNGRASHGGAGQSGGRAAGGQITRPPTPDTTTSTNPPESGTAKPTWPVKPTGPSRTLRTTGTKAVALTFDDGPDPTQTPQILRLLAKNHAKATFCLVGTQVVKHPEIVRQIAAAGHTLCNHTWQHSLTIGKAKSAQIRADLQRTNAAIETAVPGATVRFFRAPGGNFTDRLVDVANGEQMTSLYWAVDPRDWEHRKRETDAAHIKRVVAAVQRHVRPGSIVLSHDFNQPDTIAAYEQLLPWLTDHFTLGIPGQSTAKHGGTGDNTIPLPTRSPATPAPTDPPAPTGSAQPNA